MKKSQLLLIIAMISYWGLIAVLKTHKLEHQVRIQNENYKLHSTNPCMTLPDNTPCTDQTVYKELPSGESQRVIMRVCAYKSPVRQAWKGE